MARHQTESEAWPGQGEVLSQLRVFVPLLFAAPATSPMGRVGRGRISVTTL